MWVWVSHLDPRLLFLVLLGPWCPGLPLKPEQLLSVDPPRKTLLEGFTGASQSRCREDELEEIHCVILFLLPFLLLKDGF